MAELKEWQSEVGKVSLKEGQRAFVLPDGRVIATDTNNDNFQSAMKEKYAMKRAKLTEKRKPLYDKLSDLRKERNELKKALNQAEKGQRQKLKRLAVKKSKRDELEKEIQALEKIP